MIKKRSYCADSVPVILVCALLVLVGICLFLLLQHVPMKQMMYAFSENHTIIPFQKEKQATSSKMAFAPIQTITYVPLKLTKIMAYQPTSTPHVPIKLYKVNVPNKLTHVRSKRPYHTFKLTNVKRPSKRSRKMHYVEIVPEGLPR